MRRQWRAAGLCSKCGGERDEAPWVTCSTCREKARKRKNPNGPGPGRPKGIHRSWVPWSDHDKAIIDEAEAKGIKTRALFDSGVLPGRSMVDIQNQFGMLRRRRRGQCPQCRGYKGTKGKPCEECLALAREERREIIAQGLCSMCRRPRGEDGTTTMCRVCAKKNQKYRYPPKAGAPKRKSKPVSVMLAWPGARSGMYLAELGRLSGCRVIDVFGGSGRLATQVGPTLQVLNDVHPLVVMLYQQTREDVHDLRDRALALCKEIQTPEELAARYTEALRMLDEVNGPPLLWMMARATWQQGSMKHREVTKLPVWEKDFASRGKRFVEATGHAEYTCLDFAEVIHRYDGPDAFFMVDPPWPLEDTFEFGIHGRYEEMLDLLVNAQGAYGIVMGSSQAASDLLAKRVPNLFWVSVAASREFLGVSHDFPDEFVQRHGRKLREVPQPETIDLGMADLAVRANLSAGV